MEQEKQSQDKIIEPGKGSYAKVARILAKSFFNDPLIKYFYPDQKSRENKTYRQFLCLLKLGFPDIKINSVSDEMKAVIVWTASDTKKKSFFRQLKAGYFFLPFQIGFSSFSRYRNYERLSKKIHIQYKKPDDHYLVILGVSPGHQKNGYSSLLMKFLFSQADLSNSRIFLETSNPDNIKIYNHFGFNVIEEISIPSTSLKIYPMMKIK